MSKTSKTYLFCFDDHRNFTSEIRKKFSDESKYELFSFQSKEEYLHRITGERENKSCKIAILAVNDPAEQTAIINQLVAEIRRLDPKMGIIVVCPPDRAAEAGKELKIIIDGLIPRNSNSVLRVHNVVKRIISEYNIRIYRKRRNISVLMLLAFALLAVILYFLAV